MRRNQLAMIVLILTLFSACGKKNRAPRHPSGHIQGAPNYSIQDAASINNYKNRISCSFGQGRRIPDVTFNTTGGHNRLQERQFLALTFSQVFLAEIFLKYTWEHQPSGIL
jgi:hypothetical protein